MIEEISQHGSFESREDARIHAAHLNCHEGSDNLQYVVKIKDGKYVVSLLAGLSDDSIEGDT